MPKGGGGGGGGRESLLELFPRLIGDPTIPVMSIIVLLLFRYLQTMLHCFFGQA